MPWLSMHIMLPFAVAAGFGLQAIWNEKWKYAIVGICVILLSLSFAGAVKQSFYDYDDPSNKEFAYVQTNRDIFRMISDVESRNNKEHVKVVSPDYTWAIYWYGARKNISFGHYKDIPNDLNGRVILSTFQLNLTDYRVEDYNLGHHGIYHGYYRK